MKIVLGRQGTRSVAIDLKTLLVSRLLLQANSGGGKSWLLRRIAEQMVKYVQVIIIDPEGEFATLREKYPFLLVGEGGDTPADPRTAPLLAERLLELRASAVCDLYEAFRGQPMLQRQWVSKFLFGIVNAPKRLWHPVIVITDEAHRFCPQENPKGGSQAERDVIMGCKESMIALSTLGRKRGFCAVWATQRLAKVDKDASGELHNRLVGLTFEDVDVERAVKLLGVSSEDQPAFKKEIKILDPGNFYAFGRAITKERILFKVGAVETTHPESGAAIQVVGPPPAPDKVKALLPKLSDLPKEVETKARNEAQLQAEIRALKAQLKAQPKQAPVVERKIQPSVKVETREIRIPVFAAGALAKLEKVGKQVASGIEGMNRIIGLGNVLLEASREIWKAADAAVTASRRPLSTLPAPPAPAAPRPRESAKPLPVMKPAEAGNGSAPGLDKAMRAVLTVLAQFPEGCAMGKVALLSGYRLSGGFRNTLSALRTAGYMSGSNSGIMTITQEGIAALGPYDPLPTGAELVRFWLNHRSFGQCERRIIQALVDSGQPMTMEELAQATHYEASGGFRNALSNLRTAGILAGKNSEAMTLHADLRNLIEV